MRGSGVIRIAARRIESREKKGGVAEVQVQVHARVAAKTGLISKEDEDFTIKPKWSKMLMKKKMVYETKQWTHCAASLVGSSSFLFSLSIVAWLKDGCFSVPADCTVLSLGGFELCTWRENEPKQNKTTWNNKKTWFFKTVSLIVSQHH